MLTGMYTSPRRVERDGWLVAFEGEVMAMEEAARRGLLAEPEPKPEQESEPEQEQDPEPKPEQEPEQGKKPARAPRGKAGK